MNSYVTGSIIRELREKKELKQKELADMLHVSEKTVSKWETGRGLPDIALLDPLAAALQVSLTELLSGRQITNTNQSANLIRSHWYVCPVCGNVLWSAGQGVFSCCGVALIPQVAEVPDSNHMLQLSRIDAQWFVSLNHPMTKSHSIRFIAYVTGDQVTITRLYPEQDAQSSFFLHGPGRIYAYCNLHGLFELRTPNKRQEHSHEIHTH